MAAADTSSLIAYLSGAVGADVELIEAALADRTLLLAPVVITELASDPKNGASLAALLTVKGDGETMRFVANALDQEKALCPRRQKDGPRPTGKEKLLVLFRQPDDRNDLSELKLGQHLHGNA